MEKKIDYDHDHIWGLTAVCSWFQTVATFLKMPQLHKR